MSFKSCACVWLGLVSLACGNDGEVDGPSASAPSGDGDTSTGGGDAQPGDGDTSTGGGDAQPGDGDTSTGDGDDPEATESFTLPPANGPFDYQIGGPYEPPSGVTVLSRDREAPPADGLYNICYVNGFQSQPQDETWWLSEHGDLVLRDSDGEPVIDEDWGEMLLDTSTASKREQLAAIVGEWIRGCAENGYDGIEVDNLDTYSRSGGLLSQDNNVAFMAMLSQIAHQSGLASGQKNSAEILGRAAEMGTDFAVAEECNRWDECGDYQDVYGNLVYIIEYRDQDFEKGCAEFPELSIVRRDLDVTPLGSSGYVFGGC